MLTDEQLLQRARDISAQLRAFRTHLKEGSKYWCAGRIANALGPVNDVTSTLEWHVNNETEKADYLSGSVVVDEYNTSH